MSQFLTTRAGASDPGAVEFLVDADAHTRDVNAWPDSPPFRMFYVIHVTSA